MTAALVIEMTIGLLVMAGSVQADPTVITTCPFVITSPGAYVLRADLGCSGGGTGIMINSSHVRLALERHTISGNPGTGISNSFDGVTGTPVTDVHILGPGRIQGFPSGVSLVGSVTDSEVSGITVQRSTIGINVNGQAFGTTGLTLTKNTLAGGTVGISVINLTSSTISENVASGYTVGIQILNGVTSGSPLMLSRNIVSGNPNTGVDISGGLVTAQNNVISGNGNVGINVVTGSQFGATIITNNTVSGNGTVGINVTASQIGATMALEITNNTVVATGTVDLNDAVPNCAATVWSGNTFFTANQSCIH
jgi:hypothetical protein